MGFNTKLQSKAHRGGDKEPTLSYTIVRRGERRGDNKGVQMKATWRKEAEKVGTRMLHLFRSGLIAAILPLLWGCMGGTPPAAVHHFLIDYPPPIPKAEACSAETLKVLEFATAHAYNSPSMAYSSGPFRRDSYVYSRWRVTPGEMVTDYLVRDLRRAGIFGGLFSYREEGGGRFSLEGTVDEFLENDEANTAKAVLSVTVTLLETRTTDVARLVLFQKNYRVAEAMAQKSPEALAEAMSKAVARLSDDLMGDLCKAVASKENQ